MGASKKRNFTVFAPLRMGEIFRTATVGDTSTGLEARRLGVCAVFAPLRVGRDFQNGNCRRHLNRSGGQTAGCVCRFCPAPCGARFSERQLSHRTVCKCRINSPPRRSVRTCQTTSRQTGILPAVSAAMRSHAKIREF